MTASSCRVPQRDTTVWEHQNVLTGFFWEAVQYGVATQGSTPNGLLKFRALPVSSESQFFAFAKISVLFIARYKFAGPLLGINHDQKIPPGWEGETKQTTCLSPLPSKLPCPPPTSTVLFVTAKLGSKVLFKEKVLLLNRKFEMHREDRSVRWAELSNSL